MSDPYVDLQREMMEETDDANATGAIGRVEKCVEQLNRMKIPLKRVLVVGCQGEWELHALHEGGAERVYGIDIVPEHCRAVRSYGFSCMQGAIEDSVLPPSTYNIYASHVLEHVRDLDSAVANIKMTCDRWCCITVPIEYRLSGNPAHLSPFRDPTDLLLRFRDWRILYMQQQSWETMAGAELTAIFLKPR